MTSFVVSIIGITMFFIFYKVALHKLAKFRFATDKRFEDLYEKWDNDITSLIDEFGIENIDFHCMDTPTLKKKIGDGAKIVSIGNKTDKGYDFFHSKINSGYYLGEHCHHSSSEFFYVLHGKMEISVSNSYTNILKRGDCLYIPHNIKHTVRCLEDADVIVVALPPIFPIRKVG